MTRQDRGKDGGEDHLRRDVRSRTEGHGTRRALPGVQRDGDDGDSKAEGQRGEPAGRRRTSRLSTRAAPAMTSGAISSETKTMRPSIGLDALRYKRWFPMAIRGRIRMMELRRLRLLYELSQRGTVASVAHALSYSPSSVSVQLAELEREAGMKLLRRARHNVELTPAGLRLAAYAGDALAADEAVRGEIAGMGDAPRGALRMTLVQLRARVAARGARPARGHRARPAGQGGMQREAQGAGPGRSAISRGRSRRWRRVRARARRAPP